METNRIVISKTNSPSKVIRDYFTRKEAITAYYELCDQKGFSYGSPIYRMESGKRVYAGMETGGSDCTIFLYI